MGCSVRSCSIKQKPHFGESSAVFVAVDCCFWWKKVTQQADLKLGITFYPHRSFISPATLRNVDEEQRK
jgi:hypothetical protein